jgi:diadenosine tetraphosphatase ApaH/serine/threonine PP2A family protein phosphatase
LRAAVISDVHSNQPALEATLAAIDEVGVDEIWCLGDVVGYGAQPEACAGLIQQRCTVCLAGNHDLAVLGGLDIATFSETAAVAVEWTRENISAATVEFLRGLEPAAARADVGLFHASPCDPIWEYVLSIDQAEVGLDAQEQRIGLIGHSHIALFFVRAPGARPGYTQGAQAADGAEVEVAEGDWLLNPGSVGQPRDGDPRAAWLEVDISSGRATFRRTVYPVERTQSEMRELGLPEVLAARLEHGI